MLARVGLAALIVGLVFLAGHFGAFASLDRDAFHSKAVVDPIGLFATPGKPA